MDEWMGVWMHRWMDVCADGRKKENKQSLGWILSMSFKIRCSYIFFFCTNVAQAIFQL